MGRPSENARRIMAARAAQGLASVATEVAVKRGPAATLVMEAPQPVPVPGFAAVASGGGAGAFDVAPPRKDVAKPGPAVKRSGTARAPAAGWKARRSRDDGRRAAPPVVGTISVVDVVEWLPRTDPVRLVRDAGGLVHVDVPVTSSRTGRARWDLSDVVALPHLGMRLLAVAFHVSDGKAVGSWEATVCALRSMARDLVEAGLADTPIAQLPADMMDRLEVASETRRRARLTFKLRTDFNRVRRMMAMVPGTGHIDLEHRDNREERAPQWAMDGEGTPVATPKLGLTDRDIELLAKRASVELRTSVARWNHLAAFMNDAPRPEGPCSDDELVAAAVLRHADATRAVSWRELCETGSEAWHRFLRVGWVAMGGLEREFGTDAGERLPATIVEVIRRRRQHLDSGGEGHHDFWDARKPPNMLVYEGWRVAARLAFPTAHGVIAPMVLLGLQTRFNPGVLSALPEDAFRPRSQHWIELDDVAPGEPRGDEPKRLYAAPYKPRARRLQPVDFPITERAEGPAAIAKFLRAWGQGLRDAPDAGAAEGRLCVFVSAYHGERAILSYLSSGGTLFRLEMAALCRRAGIRPLPPRALRVMGVDIIHDRTGGDEMMLRAAGNWVPGSTSPRRYLAGPTLGRDRERLFWAMRLIARERDHGIVVRGRPSSADLFSATDGFRCRNVMGSPDPLPAGELCRSRGLCAICPHGGLDVGAPAWSFSRIVTLARTIMERLPSESPRWARRYRPVLRELLDVWMPLFPDEVVAAARELPDYAYGDLPDAD